MAIFGYDTPQETYQTNNDRVTGSVFTCPSAGTADSITAYVCHTAGTVHMKCAIYKHSDLSLVGATEEKDDGDIGGCPPAHPGSWLTFNFSDPKPSLAASTEYILVCWGDASVGYVHYHEGTTDQGHYDSEAYNGFPNPMDPTHEDREYCIYCTYTPEGAAAAHQSGAATTLMLQLLGAV